MPDRQHIVAIIREDECIGCTKCIDACPVDAILGSKNYMHTVIADECIGCKLCIPPCPVDCIEMVPAMTKMPAPELVKLRNRNRKSRLAEREAILRAPVEDTNSKKQYILDAIARKRLKT